MIATRVMRHTIGFGDSGTMNDLSHMAALIDGGLDSPRVIMAARHLALSGGVRNPTGQALAIRNFLSRVWRFVEDPARRELLRDPDNLLREYEAAGVITGDCDEAAILGAALGEAVGLEAHLVALAFGGDGDVYEHVYAELLTPAGGRVSLDVTRPAGPVPPITRTLRVRW